MCSNVEKARYLKILVEEIRAAAAKRRARKASLAAPAPKGWSPKGAQPALAQFRK
jgi:hypothetical protein